MGECPAPTQSPDCTRYDEAAHEAEEDEEWK